MTNRQQAVAFNTEEDLPTYEEFTHLGMLMWHNATSSLYLGTVLGWQEIFRSGMDSDDMIFASDAGGTFSFDATIPSPSHNVYDFPGIGAGTIVLEDATQTITNKTIDTANNDITVSRSDVTDFYKHTFATYGPFFANDIVGTGTQSLQAAFFDTATTVLRSTPDVYMASAGEVIGISVISDSNRTAGTATVELLVNGATQTFDGGAVCVLDATNTRRHAVMVTLGNGEDFSAGQRIALQVTTSGWTPTTANLAAWFTVRFDLA